MVSGFCVMPSSPPELGEKKTSKFFQDFISCLIFKAMFYKIDQQIELIIQVFCRPLSSLA